MEVEGSMIDPGIFSPIKSKLFFNREDAKIY
jgi:hypothetical protein